MSRPRTAVATVLALLVTLWVTAGAASAHEGGGAAFTGEAGPYTVYAYDGVPGTEPGSLAYSVILRRTTDGAPVDGATLTAAADPADGSSASAVAGVQAQSVANVYELTLPDPGPGSWQARLTVDGPDGPGSTDLTLHGVAGATAAPDGTPVWVVAVGGAAAALGLAAAVGASRRRTRPGLSRDGAGVTS